MPNLKLKTLRARLALFCFIPLMSALSGVLTSLFYYEDVDWVTLEDGTKQEMYFSSPFEPYVVPAMLLLAIPIAVLAWAWAGSVVRPLLEITQTASDIQSGSLDKRIYLPNALSEFNGLARQFNRMMDRLEAEANIQTQLIEDTSHEIRTPLAVLATNAEVMLANPAPSLTEYRDCTELTAKTVTRLRKTVELLLNGATFASLKIRQSDNDLSVVAQRAIESCSETAKLAQVDLVTETPQQLFCAFDGRSVERALCNLLNNAIRFSPSEGKVLLKVGVENDLAFASVEDLGRGIDISQHKLVFDRYVSSAEPTSSNNGIGLAIVKQVADAHNGITIDSPIDGDQGTRFTMWFQQ